MASLFGAAFDKLDRDVQQKLLEQLKLRRLNYLNGLAGRRWSQVSVILVGDRPGNGAKKLPANHHHTPFYSTKNSSLWLNRLLVDAGVHENDLFWINSADLNGVATDPKHLDGWNKPTIIALGANASAWLEQHGRVHEKVHHPQAWKRFHSKDPYPLIDLLKKARST